MRIRIGMTTAWIILWTVVAHTTMPASAAGSAAEAENYPDRMALVVVLDGLRPDLITPTVMPMLHGLAERGVWCTNHHAVFPTVTRVNASALATGCYPAKTGIVGNRMYVPGLGKNGLLDTGSASALMRYEQKLGGSVLTCRTMGDVLVERGMRVAVASSGSSGSAFLLDANHRGVTVHYSYTRPESVREEVLKRCGQPGPDAAPNIRRNAFAVRAYLDYLLPQVKPHLTYLWLSDPDHTQHEHGLGAPKSLDALRAVDGLLATIVKTLKSKELLDRTNIFVVSDHGFSTHRGTGSVTKMLIEAGLKESEDSTDVVVAGGAIHVNSGGRAKVGKIVEFLQRQDEIGAIFTPSHEGKNSVWAALAGTFSQSFVHWSHARSGQILLSAAWADEPGPFGFRGITMQRGVAGHGTASPFDIRNTLIISGPGIRNGIRSDVPSGNVDVAPTICRLLGLDVPDFMDGRVLSEAFEDGPHPWTVPFTAHLERDETRKVFLRYSTVPRQGGGSSIYLDFAGRR